MTKRKRSKVYIVNPNTGRYEAMFQTFGVDVVENIRDADFVQFTGGEDITPKLYGQKLLPGTFPNRSRDRYEVFLYSLLRKDKIPMAGICRGAQLLNALMGGETWQSVTGHKVPHSVYSKRDDQVFTCSSQHHQMMALGDGSPATVVLLANASTNKVRASRHTGMPLEIILKPKKDVHSLKDGEDIEALVYTDERILCVQGHPEHGGFGIFTDWYMENLSRYLSVRHGGR
jgi:gamma-glutamyl-gamma-aminobutyrate hydrolase PuuD